MSLWLAAARTALAPAARRLGRALEQPDRAQADVRRAVATDLARTAYGRSLGVRGPDDLDARVPVVSWERLAPWLARQRAEEGRVLLAERVLFYEKTSGSTGPAKYVPYTATLRRTYSRMFAAWVHDLLARGPKLHTGKLYFSVSPSFAPAESTPQGVAVGTADDRDYLEGWLRPLLSRVVVTPPGLGRERDVATYYRRLATALLAAPDLEVISVWSPSALLVLLDWMRDHADVLGSPALVEVARGGAPWSAVWPALRLISCWDRGGAAPLARRVAALFPGVRVQGKGLLATEAPVTIPWIGAPAPVPLVSDVLVELEADDGRLLPLVDAVEGTEYRVVVSPRGGLVRYALGDRVVATGRVGQTPCLDFVGRGGVVSDLVGEKLSEAWVAQLIGALELGPSVGAALVPVRTPHDHYVLVVDGLDGVTPARLLVLAEAVEVALSAAHHYRHARALGQLAPARVVAQRGALEWLRAAEARRGVAWGNIKDRVLVTTPADAALSEQLV